MDVYINGCKVTAGSSDVSYDILAYFIVTNQFEQHLHTLDELNVIFLMN